MDYQLLLQREASAKGYTLTSLCQVNALLTSQKVACCGGLLEKIVAESAQDCTVLLRDATGTVHCAIHGAVSSRYPDVLASGALLLLRDVTVLVTPTLMQPVLIVCLEHLVALMLPEGPPESGQNTAVGFASSASPFTDLPPHQEEYMSNGCQDTARGVTHKRPREACLGSVTPVAANPTPKVSAIPSGVDSDEDCLQLADDL
ncbi:hypothetical protein TraAM80_00831 [Trypanosoma rangeli]|uniref:Homologous recombination OB-fold protein OB-fold domain-containing protein n=1 Tax=Trypanosoma rangeli TaxID=5698 RepID=A0A422P1T2_TRYRA|nr:uncharacterized protein TraAM80_00831 [Trypanosoma rangeli]RNF11635.1 hypothetical protein TraAM80_00831 [Trypanosoma rangeli]|eukprot:RNF11635.1 hypothetical protein TraAM80_00831 [Trypanosoma rangeli]